MRRLILAVPLMALAAPAMAQDTEGRLDDMTRAMGDPVRQQAMARAMAAVADVVLDLPLAPIVGPIAEAAGEDPREIDRDATLRKMSPSAGDASRRIERELPRAMGAMAGMSSALAGLLPQLREAADRVRDALPDGGLADLP